MKKLSINRHRKITSIPCQGTKRVAYIHKDKHTHAGTHADMHVYSMFETAQKYYKYTGVCKHVYLCNVYNIYIHILKIRR